MSDECTEIELSPEEHNRKVAFHEAAHAVLFWNLGIGVKQVWVDRVRHCGHAQGLRHRKDRKARVSYAVACFGGLAAHSYVEPNVRWDDVVRAFTDFRRALVDILPPCDLTDGEQLGVALAVTKRVAVLLQTPEVKRQIYTLVPPLLRNGCLLHRQVESILQALPESAAARRKSRELVEELEKCRGDLIARAKGYAPDFRWSSTAE